MKFEWKVYLLTDGEVGNTQSIIDLIRSNRVNMKVHSFGIGDGVSTELIKKSAQAGGGHFYFILDPNDIEKKVV